MFVKTVSKISLLQGRYRIEVKEAFTGSLVLLEGIDQAVTKTSTIISADIQYDDVDIITPLKFWT